MSGCWEKRATDELRKVFDTTDIPGRMGESRCQQRSINAHNLSVRPGWTGRTGCSPSNILILAVRALRGLNGGSVAKTCVRMKRSANGRAMAGSSNAPQT